MKFIKANLGTIFFCFAVTACSPEVGSDEWCAAMKEKPRGEWSANELGDFTRHCVFK